MIEQIPHGPSDKYCPLFRKRADKVCHTCMWWTMIQMDHPQNDGEKIHHYMCAQQATVFTTMDAGRQQRDSNKTMQQTAAMIQQGNVASHAAIVGMTEMFNRVAPVVAAPQIASSAEPPKLLEG